ncbi:MAG: trigger factor [Planctomycetota bacterium]
MQLEVDTSAPAVAKVSLTVPADEFDREVKSGLRHVSQNMRMKGFRPGKVPLKVLEKQFGEGVRNEVKESFVQRAYGQAMEENELKPIAHPRLTQDDMSLADDGSFKVEFEVPLRPDFDLPDYRGMSVTSELEPVMDEQIDQAIADIRQQQATPEPAGDDGIDENGFVVGDLKFEREGNAVFEREGMRLNAQSVPPGVEAEAFEEALKGAKDEARIELAMTIPDFVEDEDARGQDGTCVIEVAQAMNLVPATDEQLFEMLGDEVDDMDGLRKFVSERLAEAAQEREENRIEGVLLDQILDQCKFDLPESMVDQQTEARLAQVEQQLAGSGQTEEQIEAAKDEQRESARTDAAKGLRALLVVETIGEKEELLVTNEDIDGELSRIAERNQSTLEEVREYYGQNNLGQQLAIEILERKVRRFLRENADIQAPS